MIPPAKILFPSEVTLTGSGWTPFNPAQQPAFLYQDGFWEAGLFQGGCGLSHPLRCFKSGGPCAHAVQTGAGCVAFPVSFLFLPPSLWSPAFLPKALASGERTLGTGYLTHPGHLLTGSGPCGEGPLKTSHPIPPLLALWTHAQPPTSSPGRENVTLGFHHFATTITLTLCRCCDLVKLSLFSILKTTGDSKTSLAPRGPWLPPHFLAPFRARLVGFYGCPALPSLLSADPPVQRTSPRQWSQGSPCLTHCSAGERLGLHFLLERHRHPSSL